ncbi:esterase/lipase family protein [Streptacidiphilus sp. PAMC 29251]
MVVVPGILGSRLAKDGKEVWGTSGPALWRGIRTFGGSARQLRLPQDLGDGHPGDGVEAVGLVRDVHGLPGMGPLVNGYSDLVDWLELNFTLRRAIPGGGSVPNLIEFGYDWRLSCRYNAERLRERIDQALGAWRAGGPATAEAKVTFICHSMGGLVTRHYVEQLGGAEVTRRVITLGTPHRGSLDALETLVNGMPLGLTPFAQSLPSLHQLAPDYACIVGGRGLLRVDETGGLPGVDAHLLRDAASFHARLRTGPVGYQLLPVTGVLQPTLTTATYAAGRLTGLDAIEGTDEGGDGRVPRLSSGPHGVDIAYTPAEQHGSLQNNAGVRDFLWGILAGAPAYHRGPGDEIQLGVRAEAFVPAGTPYRVTAVVPASVKRHDELALRATLSPVEEGDRLVVRQTMGNRGGGHYTTDFAPPTPGLLYRLTVQPVSAEQAGVTLHMMVADGGIDGG